MKPIHAFAAAILLASAASAQQTFRDSGAFIAALNGRDPVVEGFEGAKFGQLIPDGSEFGGLVWQFAALGENQGGLVANTYWVLDTQGLFLERDGEEGPGAGDYFYPGESFTVLFPEPVMAVGMFINVGVADVTDYITLDTDQGSAYSGGPFSEETVHPGLFFVGIVADGPINKAVFGVTPAGLTGWNADNLMYLPIGGDDCYADLNGDGVLDLFDFLQFLNDFDAEDPIADCTLDGVHDFFDFLCFSNEFNAGC